MTIINKGAQMFDRELTEAEIFDEMMAVIQRVDPKRPVPAQLKTFLEQVMLKHPAEKEYRCLEPEGRRHRNAYFVVKGFVPVFGYDKNCERYTFRLYRQFSIVALDALLDQEISDCSIYAAEKTVVWSLSYENIQKLYAMDQGMKGFVADAARKYSIAKETVRRKLLAMKPDCRVLMFYTLFKGLLPARTAPLLDVDIASYLLLSPRNLLEIRQKLRINGREEIILK